MTLSCLVVALDVTALSAVALRAAELDRLSHPRANLDHDYYIIGPGDILELRLFDAPELSGNLDVLNDGTISLPLVGSVRVSGLTLQQAADWVKQLLSSQLLRPELQ